MEIWGGSRAADRGVRVPGIDAHVLSVPHAGSADGGDIHYVSMCAAGKIARFALSDVAGHGESVAHLARDLRDLMRRSINTPDQTRFARALNRAFAELATAGRFATAVLATYWAPTDHLILTCAGHPRPLLYRAADRSWSTLDDHQPPPDAAAVGIRNLPLGVIDDTEYGQTAVPLGPGDAVVLYSDAFIEARPPGGRQLGPEGLLEAAASLGAPADPGCFARALHAAACVHAGGPLDDDATVVVLSHTATEPQRPTLRERAAITARLLGLVDDDPDAR
jgi:serine phosphatase RsbU (regulator of sigma subunit)